MAAGSLRVMEALDISTNQRAQWAGGKEGGCSKRMRMRLGKDMGIVDELVILIEISRIPSHMWMVPFRRIGVGSAINGGA